MHCLKCGTENSNRVRRCYKCGMELQYNWIIKNDINIYERYLKKTIPDYFIQSIIATFFCCLPLGIIAIMFSRQVDERLKIGDYSGAEYASKRARNYCLMSLLIGIIVMILYLFAASIAR